MEAGDIAVGNAPDLQLPEHGMYKALQQILVLRLGRFTPFRNDRFKKYLDSLAQRGVLEPLISKCRDIITLGNIPLNDLEALFGCFHRPGLTEFTYGEPP